MTICAWLTLAGILVFVGVMTWLLAPLHDPNKGYPPPP